MLVDENGLMSRMANCSHASVLCCGGREWGRSHKPTVRSEAGIASMVGNLNVVAEDSLTPMQTRSR